MTESGILDAFKTVVQLGDPINIVLAMVLTRAVRPWLITWPAFAANQDRLLIVPVVIGVIIGIGVEATTKTFAISVAIRRSLACGCGAAVAYRFIRVFFPGSNGSTAETPKP